MALKQDPLSVTLNEIQRAEAVMQLRIAGHSYTFIAKQLGYAGRQGPHEVVKRHLRELREGLALKTDDVRELELERIDALLRTHWRPATTGLEMTDSSGRKILVSPKTRAANLKSAEFVLKLLERRSRLLGLDAPLDIRHTGSVELLSYKDAHARIQAALREGSSAADGSPTDGEAVVESRRGDATNDPTGDGGEGG